MEKSFLLQAVHRAPTRQRLYPWVLEPHGQGVYVVERAAALLPRHNRAGRDRLMSCGAAVANLRLATRVLGWAESWSHFPDPHRRDVVAVVRARRPAEPTERDRAMYRATARRPGRRAGRASVPSTAERFDVLAANDALGVAVVPLDDCGEGVTRLFAGAARKRADDPASRAELAAWTGAADFPGTPGVGGPEGEWHFAVITTGDNPTDHLHAGLALQQTWLAATTGGFASSVTTRALHLPEVREGLIEIAELPGFPQAVLRVGGRAPAPGACPAVGRPARREPRKPR